MLENLEQNLISSKETLKHRIKKGPIILSAGLLIATVCLSTVDSIHASFNFISPTLSIKPKGGNTEYYLYPPYGIYKVTAGDCTLDPKSNTYFQKINTEPIIQFPKISDPVPVSGGIYLPSEYSGGNYNAACYPHKD